MFQGLRQQSMFYILEKTEEGLVLKSGQVVSVSNPQPRYNQFPSMPTTYTSQPEMVVDVKVKVGEETIDFKQLSANQCIANSGNVVVSESREAMSAEVEGMMHASKQHITAVPYHEKIIGTGESIMRVLNPQFAKEKEQEEKISALEGRMGNIDDKLNKMFDLLSDTLERNKSRKTKED